MGQVVGQAGWRHFMRANARRSLRRRSFLCPCPVSCAAIHIIPIHIIPALSPSPSASSSSLICVGAARQPSAAPTAPPSTSCACSGPLHRSHHGPGSTVAAAAAPLARQHVHEPAGSRTNGSPGQHAAASSSPPAAAATAAPPAAAPGAQHSSRRRSSSQWCCSRCHAEPARRVAERVQDDGAHRHGSQHEGGRRRRECVSGGASLCDEGITKSAGSSSWGH